MKALLFCVIFFNIIENAVDRKVYVCDSSKAKKYHLKNDCHGLNRCTHQIVELTEADAKKKGFELCKFEK